MNAKILEALTELWWQDAMVFGGSLLFVTVSAIVMNYWEERSVRKRRDETR